MTTNSCGSSLNPSLYEKQDKFYISLCFLNEKKAFLDLFQSFTPNTKLRGGGHCAWSTANKILHESEQIFMKPGGELELLLEQTNVCDVRAKLLLVTTAPPASSLALLVRPVRWPAEQSSGCLSGCCRRASSSGAAMQQTCSNTRDCERRQRPVISLSRWRSSSATHSGPHHLL